MGIWPDVYDVHMQIVGNWIVDVHNDDNDSDDQRDAAEQMGESAPVDYRLPCMPA